MVLFSFYVEVFVENACVCIRLIGPTYVVLFIWLFAVFTVMLLGWSLRLSMWIKLILPCLAASCPYEYIYQCTTRSPPQTHLSTQTLDSQPQLRQLLLHSVHLHTVIPASTYYSLHCPVEMADDVLYCWPLLPAVIAKNGIVFNVSVCQCICLSTKQEVVLETHLVVWTTI